MPLDKVKTYSYREKAKSAYTKIRTCTALVITAIVTAIVYIFDAFHNFIIKARTEPFIFLASAATMIYVVFGQLCT